MFNNFPPVLFCARQSTALLTSALLVAGWLNPFLGTVQATPRYQRVATPTRSAVNYGNNPYPYAPRSDYRLSQQYNGDRWEVPVETLIPVTLNQGQSFTIKKGENQSLTLRTTSPLRQTNGAIAVPAGSEIVGQFRPVANGSGVRFVAHQLVLRNGQFLPINAQSRELVGFEQRNRQASASEIITGTLAGAGTATLIAGTTGDRRINALEVLGGAAAGALAGWGLPTAGIIGGSTEEVMTVSSRDLTLMLQSPLYLDPNQLRDTNQSNPRNWNSASW
ncbi:MAG: hypothetical protein RLZZ490_96 [Cyanobacteriota bacterium]